MAAPIATCTTTQLYINTGINFVSSMQGVDFDRVQQIAVIEKVSVDALITAIVNENAAPIVAKHPELLHVAEYFILNRQ